MTPTEGTGPSSSETTSAPPEVWAPSIIWELPIESLVDNSSDRVKGIVLADDEVFVVGQRNPALGYALDAWIARIDAIEEQGAMGLEQFFNHDNVSRVDTFNAGVATAAGILAVGHFRVPPQPLEEQPLLAVTMFDKPLQAFPDFPANPGFDTIRGVVDDADGAWFVVGTKTSPATEQDAWVARFDATDGAMEWEQTFDYAGGRDEGNSILLTPEGRLFVTGGFTDADGAPRSWVAQLRPADGDLVDAQISDEADAGEVLHDAVRVPGGQIVVGEQEVDDQGLDLLLRRVGDQLGLGWETTLGGVADEQGSSVTVSPRGEIFACGQTTIESRDMWIVKFDEGGNVLGEFTIDGPGQGEDIAATCRTLPNGDVLVGGSRRTGVGTGTQAYLARISG